MQIALGALAPKLSEQLDGLLSAKDIVILDEDAAAITRLYIRGYIPESAAHTARKRLVKEIERRGKDYEKSKAAENGK